MKDNLRVSLKDLISAAIPIEKFFRIDLFLLRWSFHDCRQTEEQIVR